MDPPSTPKPLQLSQEVLDTIIDYLQTDRATLAACGAVSSAWLPRSRRHLFRAVDMRTIPYFSLDNIASEEIDARIQTFTMLANSPKCTFLPYIQKMDCCYSIMECDDWKGVFAALESHLHHINSARMWYNDSEQYHIEDYDWQPFQNAFKNVTMLEIRNVIFWHNDQIAEFLSGFHSLENLWFNARSIVNTDEEVSEQWKLSPRLKTLTTDRRSGPIHKWLALQPMLGLEELDLVIVDTDHLPLLQRIPHMQSLRRLKVASIHGDLPKAGEDPEWFEVYKNTPWSAFGHMQVLTLTDIYQDMTSESVTYLILSSFVHPIHELNLEFRYWDHDTTSEFDTVSLKKSLSGPAYLNARVNFIILNEGFGREYVPDADVVEATLAFLRERLGPELSNVTFSELRDMNTSRTDGDSIPLVGWSTERWDDTRLGGTADPRTRGDRDEDADSEE